MKGETTGTSSPASKTSKKRGKKGGKLDEKKQKTGNGHGGARPGTGGRQDHAGRLTKAERLQALGVSDTIEAHLVQEVELVDGGVPKLPEGHEPIKSKKPRLVAILDMLAVKALGPEQSIPAATEYLNRTLGRAKQTVEVSGAIKTEEQSMPSKAEMAAARAYEDELEDDE